MQFTNFTDAFSKMAQTSEEEKLPNLKICIDNTDEDTDNESLVSEKAVKDVQEEVESVNQDDDEEQSGDEVEFNIRLRRSPKLAKSDSGDGESPLNKFRQSSDAPTKESLVIDIQSI
jgi:hypothetical protein